MAGASPNKGNFPQKKKKKEEAALNKSSSAKWYLFQGNSGHPL